MTARDSEVLLRVRGLSKTYDGREALRVEELDVPRGVTCCIVGPTGAGKTTLLRLLDLLETPTSGTISLGGSPMPRNGRGIVAWRRRMALVPQRPGLFDLTVAGNVQYGLQVRGLRGPEARDRVAWALAEVGLAGYASRRAATLSGGESQRLALARALVLDPEVLLLDEPTANLDPAGVALVEGLVKKLRRRGTTLLLVTHNVFQARRLADKVVFLLAGRVVEQGPASQVFSSPRDPRTAAFLAGELVC